MQPSMAYEEEKLQSNDVRKWRELSPFRFNVNGISYMKLILYGLANWFSNRPNFRDFLKENMYNENLMAGLLIV